MSKNKGFTTNGAIKNSGLPLKKDPWRDDGTTVPHMIRLHKKRKAALKYLFSRKGLDLGAGVRMVMYDWLQEHSRELREWEYEDI